MNRWSGIVAECPQPLKTYIKAAKLSLGGDNKLMLVLEDGIASDYLIKQPENRQLLEQIISESIGKEVEVNVQSVGSAREFESNYVDLSQIIHMDIEEED